MNPLRPTWRRPRGYLRGLWAGRVSLVFPLSWPRTIGKTAKNNKFIDFIRGEGYRSVMSSFNDIKKRLASSTTMPAGTGGGVGWLMGSARGHAHHHDHAHAADGSCCGGHHHHHDDDEDDTTNPSGGCC